MTHQFYGIDVSGEFTARSGCSINMGNNIISNIGVPITNTDAATKQYVDTIINISDIKKSVISASTLDLSSSVVSYLYDNTGNGQITATLTVPDTFTLDTIIFSSTDNGTRILLKNQSSADENGIWIITISGTSLVLDRPTDFYNGEVSCGASVYVEDGGQSGTFWVLTTLNPITIGGASGTNLNFSQYANSTLSSYNLMTSSAPVDIGSSMAPSANQVLVATSATTATWQVLPPLSVIDNYPYTQVNTDAYSATTSDYIIGVLYSPTGKCTITLPQISTIPGGKKQYVIVDEGGNASINSIIIQGSVDDKVNGSTFELNGDWNSVILYSNTVSVWFTG